MPVLTYKQIQALMRKVGFPEDQIILGAAVFRQESGFDTDAVNNGSGTNSVEYSVGLAQINTLYHKNYSIAQLKNPEINLKEALRIYRNDKDRNKNLKLWRSWGGYTDGKYKKYLAASETAYASPANVDILPGSLEDKTPGQFAAVSTGAIIATILLILAARR